jgi:serine phosphatase RsbU (regulator of sigma subunit)
MAAFVTVFLVMIDICGGEITYAGAGHLPPIIIRSDHSIETLEVGQLPLALFAEQDFAEHHAHIHPGDKLLMYTDGISEARHDGVLLDVTGVERVIIENASLPASRLAKALISAATEWTGGRLQDDAAVVVVERGGI